MSDSDSRQLQDTGSHPLSPREEKSPIKVCNEIKIVYGDSVINRTNVVQVVSSVQSCMMKKEQDDHQ